MNLNNTVIEVLNREHGQKVKKFFQENGISTSHFLFNGNKEDNNAWRYYGLISNEFNFYSWAQVQNAGAKIMILPEEYTNFAEEGYKFLKEGEMILESDEWLEKGKWHKFNKDRPSTIGTKFEKSYCPHRRKITKTQNMKTQTISKTNLKLIHDIACSSWQTKLESKAKENPWSDSVEFTEEEVKEIFKASTPAQLPLVYRFFIKPVEKKLNIITRIPIVGTLKDSIESRELRINDEWAASILDWAASILDEGSFSKESIITGHEPSLFLTTCNGHWYDENGREVHGYLYWKSNHRKY